MPRVIRRNARPQVRPNVDLALEANEDLLHEKMQQIDPDIRFGRAKNVITAGGALTDKMVPMKHTPLVGGSFFDNVMSGGTIQSKSKNKNRNNLKFVI